MVDWLNALTGRISNWNRIKGPALGTIIVRSSDALCTNPNLRDPIRRNLAIAFSSRDIIEENLDTSLKYCNKQIYSLDEVRFRYLLASFALMDSLLKYKDTKTLQASFLLIQNIFGIESRFVEPFMALQESLIMGLSQDAFCDAVASNQYESIAEVVGLPIPPSQSHFRTWHLITCQIIHVAGQFENRDSFVKAYISSRYNCNYPLLAPNASLVEV